MVVIGSDPAATFRCRPLDPQSVVAKREGGSIDAAKPTAVVDIADGWSVVVFWRLLEYKTQGGTPARTLYPSGVVTNGVRYVHIVNAAWDWPGTYSTAGVAFTDGPKALGAARECIGA